MLNQIAAGQGPPETHAPPVGGDTEYNEPAGETVIPADLVPAVGDPTIGRPEPSSALSVAEICDAIVALGRERRFCIVSQSRCDRSIEAFLARLAGYSVEHQERDRKALFALAKKLRKGIEKTGLDGAAKIDPSIAKVAPLVLASAQSRGIWDDRRAEAETEMRRLAQQLPAWKNFAAEVRGLGSLGLAVVVAETGDLGKYATPAKVWKRLGLAVIGDVRQQRRTDPAEAAAHGYSPQRRAEIWAFFSDTMLRSVWRGPKDDVPGYPLGPYGAEYARKKTEYLEREWTPAHADAAARRYMTKCVIRDLWAAWRSASTSLEPSDTLPAAKLIEPTR